VIRSLAVDVSRARDDAAILALLRSLRGQNLD
jgi:hypothetical protein